MGSAGHHSTRALADARWQPCPAAVALNQNPLRSKRPCSRGANTAFVGSAPLSCSQTGRRRISLRYPSRGGLSSLSRPASAAAISLGCRYFSHASRLASERTQTRGHPVARTEESHEQPRQVNIRVDFGKMNAKPGRRDFDFSQLRRSRILKPLCIAWRKRNIEPRRKMNQNPPSPAIVTRMGNARGREAASTELNLGQHTETMKLYHKPKRLGSLNSEAISRPRTVSRQVAEAS